MKKILSSLLITGVLLGLHTPRAHADEASLACGSSGVRGLLSQQAPLLTQIAGGNTYVCGNGTLVALGSAITPGNDWWRIATTKNSWRNPLVSVCVVPLKSTAKVYEAWYNSIGVHTPYNSDELNYVTSYRHDGKLITKKEVTNYTNLSPYLTVTKGLLLNTRVGIAVSRVVDSTGKSIIRTWIQLGSCTVDTTKAPQLIGTDSTKPSIIDGAVAIRTDFLLHRVLRFTACEADPSGRSCTDTRQVLVPVRNEN